MTTGQWIVGGLCFLFLAYACTRPIKRSRWKPHWVEVEWLSGMTKIYKCKDCGKVFPRLNDWLNVAETEHCDDNL